MKDLQKEPRKRPCALASPTLQFLKDMFCFSLEATGSHSPECLGAPVGSEARPLAAKRSWAPYSPRKSPSSTWGTAWRPEGGASSPLSDAPVFAHSPGVLLQA